MSAARLHGHPVQTMDADELYCLPLDRFVPERDALGRAPDAAGLVDHEAIGTAWEHAKGATSIVEMVFAELKGGAR